jgi:Zn2+/Cd2+-exporting ATPase
MDCAEEVSLLRRQLSRKPGIYDLSFQILEARMTVKFDPDRITARQIVEAVAALGMRAEPWSAPRAPQGRNWRVATTAISGSLVLAGMLLSAVGSDHFWLAMLSHGEHGHDHGGRPLIAIACFLAAAVVGFGPALPKAAIAARALRPDLHVLMTVSIVGAFVLGEFPEAGALAFLFSVSGLLENWSTRKARSAIGSLMRLSPASASVLHGDHEHRVPVDQLKVGDVVRVRPGERIPCDGLVAAGRSTVDQAIITGESVPIEKSEGAKVYAGAMNGEGALEVRVTTGPSDTTLARIIRMVQESGRRRAPSEQFVERFALYYTPAMIVLASLVGAVPPLLFGESWSYWFYQGMVVLLISCPCALVISTPVTIAAALASAARHGVLIKGGVFLEEAARLKAVAFDKTGVLTRGKPVVQTFVPMDGRPPAECLRRLAGLEHTSEHPLGRAIVEYATRAGVWPDPVDDFQSLPGRGAQGEIGGETFWVGSHRFLREKDLATPEVSRALARLEDSDHTAVACGTEREVWALVGLQDPVRPEAGAALAALRRAGIGELVMLTGDNRATAQAVSGELGLTSYHPDLLPSDKEAAVQALRRAHGSVAMVGDGVNDAQAMAAASVGIALGRRSTDVALETADIVLTADDLSKVPFLVSHSRRAARVIRQNVAAALGMKAGFLALAAFGMATLWMAVVADMGASLLVTFNGLRLLRAKYAPPRPEAAVGAAISAQPAGALPRV